MEQRQLGPAVYTPRGHWSYRREPHMNINDVIHVISQYI